MLKAIIFDCDGVLVDTERDVHRVAFNRAFAAEGIDAEWSVALYGELLLVAGGKERMTHYFEHHGWPDHQYGPHEELIAQLHKKKTAIGAEMIAKGEATLRPGIARIVDEAIAAGVTLGVCTTSNAKFIDAVLDLLGPERKAKFAFVHAGDVVKKKKPDPAIYELAKQSLGVGDGGPTPEQCIVIEDSRNGLLAATGAGLPTLVTTSTYTVDEDFHEAAKVVPELGDGDRVNITLQDLEELAARKQTA
jgi:HAD superfamily hydrolase (TIGR01509 family)